MAVAIVAVGAVAEIVLYVIPPAQLCFFGYPFLATI